MSLFDKFFRRSPIVTGLEAVNAPSLDPNRPTYAVDFPTFRVVPTNDLQKLRDENAWTSGTWGWRVFQPYEVFTSEVEGWKAVRKYLMERRRTLRRSWQAIMQQQHLIRQHHKKHKTTIPYPNRFYLFDHTEHEIIAVYTDQMEAEKEYIGEIRQYTVNIGGNCLGTFPKEQFFDTYDKAAKCAGVWFSTNLKIINQNYQNITEWLYQHDWSYLVETSYGPLYARNRKLLRKQLIRAVESGWLVLGVTDAAGHHLKFGWKPVMLPAVVGKLKIT